MLTLKEEWGADTNWAEGRQRSREPRERVQTTSGYRRREPGERGRDRSPTSVEGSSKNGPETNKGRPPKGRHEKETTAGEDGVE